MFSLPQAMSDRHGALMQVGGSPFDRAGLGSTVGFRMASRVWSVAAGSPGRRVPAEIGRMLFRDWLWASAADREADLRVKRGLAQRSARTGGCHRSRCRRPDGTVHTSAFRLRH